MGRHPKQPDIPLAEKMKIADNVVFDPFGIHYTGCHRCHGRGTIPETAPMHIGSGHTEFQVIGHKPCGDSWHVNQPPLAIGQQ